MVGNEQNRMEKLSISNHTKNKLRTEVYVPTFDCTIKRPRNWVL